MIKRTWSAIGDLPAQALAFRFDLRLCHNGTPEYPGDCHLPASIIFQLRDIHSENLRDSAACDLTCQFNTLAHEIGVFSRRSYTNNRRELRHVMASRKCNHEEQ